ncbi:beta strand repeat-containing protein [Cypionkella sinensis]|uniref:Beta strand repeat-containing protein n=1 Tax=Cypionkella sinensis TaxID=1756043 RepID=A0ABV7J5R3_9RHOB
MATFTGGSGNDTVTAAAGTINDTLTGLAGNDTLIGLGGADLLDGGTGTDTASYASSSAGVNANLTTLTGTGGDAQGDTYISIENLIGSGQADTLTGDTGANVLSGGAGNDSLYGGAGNDTLVGGTGNDRIDGGANIDTVSYAAATAAVSVNLTTGLATGGEGSDTLVGIENVIGSNFSDTIIGDTNNNVIAGGALNDSLDGGAGIDTVDYSTSASGVTVNLQSGVNTGGDAEGDILLNFENIIGSAGADSLTGDANDNVLTGGAGADTLDGGAGVDTADYSASSAGVAVSVVSGATGSGGDAQGDRLFGIQNLIGSAFNDTLTGDAFVNVLTGGAGNDLLDGGGENDTMIGGAGDDSYVVGSSAEVITELTNEGNDLVTSSVDFTLGANLERLTLVGSLDINGTGNELNNILIGNSGDSSPGTMGKNILRGMAGNDTIYGMDGGDVLDGGTGNDSLIGGKGSDIYQVDSLNDVLVELANEGTDTVQTTVNWTLAANFENLLLDDVGNINGIGNTVANLMTGNAGNNLLSGMEGNDTLIGNAGNDTLNGGTGSDDMYGGTGNDYFYVDSSGDEIFELADGGIDTVESSVTVTMDRYVENLILSGSANINATGNTSDNIMTGNIGNNAMTGGTGNDTLYGGAGNDSLDGGIGNDVVAGGVGNDTYTINATADVVTEFLNEGTDTVIAGATWTMSDNIENLVQNGASSINATGNASANSITGNGGQNLLQGMAGNDTLDGGAGGDTLDGGAGNDIMIGGIGNDIFILDSANDVVVENLNEGIDTVQTAFSYTLLNNFENLTLLGTSGLSGTGNAMANVLTGNTGANLLSGMAGNDALFGGAGNDTLDGGTGNDSMTGGDGNDRFIVDSLNDNTFETSTGGIDTVDTSINWTLSSYTENLNLLGSGNLEGHGNNLGNIVTGNTGNNVLSGESGNDTVYGGAGNDTLDGGATGASGNDVLYGGMGDDLYFVNSLNDSIIEGANNGVDTVSSSVNWSLAANLENLILTGSSGLSGVGNASNNVMTGNLGSNNLNGLGGNDTLDGGSGADTLNGGTGDDSLIGGFGNDTYYVDSLNDVVVELANQGADTVFSSVNYTLADALENLTLNGTASINGTGNLNANVILGNAQDNYLSGMAGNDSIIGGGGNDTIDGGTGNDTMAGGIGDDSYIVDSASDRVNELTNQGIDTVYASVSYSILSPVENLTLTGTDNINATGNSSANILIGNAGNNLLSASGGNDTLDGGAGNDTLDGGAGSDSMSGGLGDDTFIIDSLNDVVSEGLNGGTDLVRSSVNHVLGANFENLTLSGSFGVNGTGNELNNVLTGNSGKNVLNGMAGDDTLTGGSGADVLIGGTGADHFVFASASTSQATISDFNSVDGGAAEGDLLEFVGLLTGTFAYIGDAAFSGTSNTEARFIAGALQLDFDGNGATDLTIRITGLTDDAQISGGDFLFS